MTNRIHARQPQDQFAVAAHRSDHSIRHPRRQELPAGGTTILAPRDHTRPALLRPVNDHRFPRVEHADGAREITYRRRHRIATRRRWLNRVGIRGRRARRATGTGTRTGTRTGTTGTGHAPQSPTPTPAQPLLDAIFLQTWNSAVTNPSSAPPLGRHPSATSRAPPLGATPYPSTTTAAPPRRGSPPPQNAPDASRSTACTPPKNRLSSRKRASARPATSRPSVATPGSA